MMFVFGVAATGIGVRLLSRRHPKADRSMSSRGGSTPSPPQPISLAHNSLSVARDPIIP